MSAEKVTDKLEVLEIMEYGKVVSNCINQENHPCDCEASPDQTTQVLSSLFRTPPNPNPHVTEFVELKPTTKQEVFDRTPQQRCTAFLERVIFPPTLSPSAKRQKIMNKVLEFKTLPPKKAPTLEPDPASYALMLTALERKP